MSYIKEYMVMEAIEQTNEEGCSCYLQVCTCYPSIQGKTEVETSEE